MKLPAVDPRSVRRTRLALGVILLVALALRLWGLDQHNIWWDEGLSAWAARLPGCTYPRLDCPRCAPAALFPDPARAGGCSPGTANGRCASFPRWPARLQSRPSTSSARDLGGRRAGTARRGFPGPVRLRRHVVPGTPHVRLGQPLGAPGAVRRPAYVARRGEIAHRRAVPWWLLYIVAATAGLWTLYLFVAVLLVVNLAFFVFVSLPRVRGRVGAPGAVGAGPGRGPGALRTLARLRLAPDDELVFDRTLLARLLCPALCHGPLDWHRGEYRTLAGGSPPGAGRLCGRRGRDLPPPPLTLTDGRPRDAPSGGVPAGAHGLRA